MILAATSLPNIAAEPAAPVARVTNAAPPSGGSWLMIPSSDDIASVSAKTRCPAGWMTGPRCSIGCSGNFDHAVTSGRSVSSCTSASTVLVSAPPIASTVRRRPAVGGLADDEVGDRQRFLVGGSGLGARSVAASEGSDQGRAGLVALENELAQPEEAHRPEVALHRPRAGVVGARLRQGQVHLLAPRLEAGAAGRGVDPRRSGDDPRLDRLGKAGERGACAASGARGRTPCSARPAPPRRRTRAGER